MIKLIWTKLKHIHFDEYKIFFYTMKQNLMKSVILLNTKNVFFLIVISVSYTYLFSADENLFFFVLVIDFNQHFSRIIYHNFKFWSIGLYKFNNFWGVNLPFVAILYHKMKNNSSIILFYYFTKTPPTKYRYQTSAY